MSLLRSTERLLEGIIGEVDIVPLIGYPITLFELERLHINTKSLVDSSPINSIKTNIVGRVNVLGLDNSEVNYNNTVLLNDFIKNEVMKFWGLPKKISIKLYESEVEEVYITRPRIIENYLLIEEVAPIHINYCQDTYSLGLGESSEILGIKYWKCKYIDTIKVYDRFGISDNWIEWVSF